MEIIAARNVANRDTYKESAAICRTSGLSEAIRFTACKIPLIISLTFIHPHLLYNDWGIIVKKVGVPVIKKIKPFSHSDKSDQEHYHRPLAER